VSVVKLFQITSLVFVRFSQNFAHMIYVPIRKKNHGTDFQNFDFKFFGKFLKFYTCT